MDTFFQSFLSGAAVGMVYGLIAVGIVFIYRATAVFNFAVGSMMAFGAYLMWTFYCQLSLPFWLSLVFTLLGSAGLGLITERLCLRPLIGEPILSSVLLTLALSYLINGMIVGFWGTVDHELPSIFPKSIIHLGKVSLSHEWLWSFMISFVIILLLSLFVRRSRIGLLMRATCEDHVIAEARGISVESIFSLVWAICGLITSAAGILLALQLGVSQSLPLIAFKAFPAIIFGGLESILGACIGGLLVGILENLAGTYITSWVMEVTPYVILLLVLIIRPHGLFGLERIERI